MAADDYTHRLRLGTPFIKHTESSVIRPCPGRLTVTKLTQLTVEIMVIWLSFWISKYSKFHKIKKIVSQRYNNFMPKLLD